MSPAEAHAKRRYPEAVDFALMRTMWTLPPQVKETILKTEVTNFPLKDFLDKLDHKHPWKISLQHEGYNYGVSFYSCSLDQLEEAAEVPEIGDKFVVRVVFRKYNDIYNLGIALVRLFFPNPNPETANRKYDAVDKLIQEELELKGN
jgi:hypothetical protein